MCFERVKRKGLENTERPGEAARSKDWRKWPQRGRYQKVAFERPLILDLTLHDGHSWNSKSVNVVTQSKGITLGLRHIVGNSCLSTPNSCELLGPGGLVLCLIREP